jgi:hypothetical protein
MEFYVWEYCGRNGKASRDWKSSKTKMFQQPEINNLPVIWRNNKTDWVTAAAMKEWMNMFNAKMKMENRNTILFLDNATRHIKVTLSNVKIDWFSANATSVLQPMDMGVIYTLKSHHRRFLMQPLISNVEEADSSYALARSVSVLDNWLNWFGLAVKKIKTETVTKCFAKAGFVESDVTDNLEEANVNIAAIRNICRGRELSCDTKDFVRK